VQDLQSFFWREEEINERLRQIMVRSFTVLYNFSREKNIDMRTAAQVFAIQRVAEAMRLRGIYP
jgi:glutamate dehydrogenase (NAD(P)+)